MLDAAVQHEIRDVEVRGVAFELCRDVDQPPGDDVRLASAEQLVEGLAWRRFRDAAHLGRFPCPGETELRPSLEVTSVPFIGRGFLDPKEALETGDVQVRSQRQIGAAGALV
jgi:hypothetical protein